MKMKVGTDNGATKAANADNKVTWDPNSAKLTNNDKILMWLMPVSQMFAWGALIVCSVLGLPAMPWLFAVGLFYWLWAVKNVVFGPLWIDLGCITFLTVVVPGVIGVIDGQTRNTRIAGCIGCGLLGAHFASALIRQLKVPGNRAAKVAKRLKKTVLWAQLFFYYILSSTCFWIACVPAIIVSADN